MNSEALLKWYFIHKRDLPWRTTKDPYKIWISEIILQQTRVNQGLQYYYRFIDAFPDAITLAEAPVDLVLKFWQGLGYYSRARNLHDAAKQIVHIYKGIFPSDFEKILSLKGIGRYTAGAISSIAFGEKVPVVDGNVYRVISRVLGITSPIGGNGSYALFSSHMLHFMGKHDAGEFNQAIMELGALVCTSQSPGCDFCPLVSDCFAYKNALQAEFPVKSKNQKITSRYFHYLILYYGGEILIHQRSGKDIWKGLYEFPLIESERNSDFRDLLSNAHFKTLVSDEFELNKMSDIFKVKLSHQNLSIRFFHIRVKNKCRIDGNYKWIMKDHVHEYAVPACIFKYLENLF